MHYIHKSGRPAKSATSDCRMGDGLWTKARKRQGKGTAGKWTGDRGLANGFPIKHVKLVLANISILLPCLCYFGKKARNNPVLWYKNIRSLGRAALIVSLAGYLILQERRVKGRAGDTWKRHWATESVFVWALWIQGAQVWSRCSEWRLCYQGH